MSEQTPVPEPQRGSNGRQAAIVAISALLGGAALLAGMWGLSYSDTMGWYLIVYGVEIVAVTVWIARSVQRSESLRSGSWGATIGWLLVAPIALAAIMGMCVSITAGSYSL